MNQNQMALEKMRKTQENLQKRKAELEELINSEGYAKAMDKMEEKRREKIEKQQLDVIANMLGQGYNQARVARETGIGKQTVSNRVALIRKDYPELYDLFAHLDK